MGEWQFYTLLTHYTDFGLSTKADETVSGREINDNSPALYLQAQPASNEVHNSYTIKPFVESYNEIQQYKRAFTQKGSGYCIKAK